jgi:heme O synthase-like polyprenyltransferase
MSRRVNAGRRSRRTNTLLWMAALAAITIALIYFEQTEILYILATLGVTALLAVVAMADLHGTEGTSSEPLPADDSAAIGTGIKKQVRSRK